MQWKNHKLKWDTEVYSLVCVSCCVTDNTSSLSFYEPMPHRVICGDNSTRAHYTELRWGNTLYQVCRKGINVVVDTVTNELMLLLLCIGIHAPSPICTTPLCNRQQTGQVFINKHLSGVYWTEAATEMRTRAFISVF